MTEPVVTDPRLELRAAKLRGASRRHPGPPASREDAADDNEIFVPSIDVCAWCGDPYCSGVGCIADLDPDDPTDIRTIERLQDTIRAGRVQIQANAVLARAENRGQR